MLIRLAFRVVPTRGLLLLGGVLLAGPPTAAAQSDRPLWFVMSGGAGYTVADTSYAASAAYVVRLGTGLRVSGRFGLDASVFKQGAVKPGGFSCTGTLNCGSRFSLLGGEGGIHMDLGPSDDPTLFRFGAGAGLVRVQADEPNARNLGNVTVLGIHAGGEAVVDDWPRGEIALGVRGLVLPDANNERIWLVTFELVLRFR